MNTYEITYNDGTKTRRKANSEIEAIMQLANWLSWRGIRLVKP